MNNKTSIKNAFYAQSGGVTAVINASACGVIETARKHKNKIGKVYAGKNGILGALNEELIDTFVTEKRFSGIKDKVERKYKKKDVGEHGLPVEETTSTMPALR